MKFTDKRIRLAPWIGCSAPTVESRATLEARTDKARSWLRHGERRSRWDALPREFKLQAG